MEDKKVELRLSEFETVVEQSTLCYLTQNIAETIDIFCNYELFSAELIAKINQFKKLANEIAKECEKEIKETTKL